MAKRIKVGDTIDLGKPAGVVLLPDGVVVTARQFYKVEHEGLHVAEGTEYYAKAPVKPTTVDLVETPEV